MLKCFCYPAVCNYFFASFLKINSILGTFILIISSNNTNKTAGYYYDKKITFIITSIISVFLLSSCYPAFDRIFRMHPARHYFYFPAHFNINSILNIIIKILIIIALIFLIKILYNKNNKKE